MALSHWLSSLKKANLRRATIEAKIQRDPYYRFQSIEEIKIAAEIGIKIDANLASMDDWLRLPGISIIQAKKLVEINRAGINFLCLEDLAAALGVSVLKIQGWQPILYFAYYATDSFIAPAKIHLNQATLEKLMTIPNLEEDTIKQILIERESNGDYRHIGDLQQRLNLNADMAYHLMNYLQF